MGPLEVILIVLEVTKEGTLVAWHDSQMTLNRLFRQYLRHGSDRIRPNELARFRHALSERAAGRDLGFRVSNLNHS